MIISYCEKTMIIANFLINIPFFVSITMSYLLSCFICNSILENSEIVTVGEKGIQGLLNKASREREDNCGELLKDLKTVVLFSKNVRESTLILLPFCKQKN